MTETTPADDLLRRTESYLSALHGSVARHDNLAANFGCAGCELRDQIAAALRAAATVPAPAPTDGAADAPAAECSAQHRQFDDGRHCIRAAQHQGDHIDERGYHWSDTVAIYPVADGTFRTGVNVRAELRRLADAASGPGQADSETQQDETQANNDTARLGKVARWVTSEVVTAQTEFGEGYRASQRDIRDLLAGRFDRDDQPAAVSQPGEEA